VRRVENIRSRTELHPLFRELMMAEILHYFEENPDEDRAVDFILSIRPEMVAPEDRQRLRQELSIDNLKARLQERHDAPFFHKTRAAQQTADRCQHRAEHRQPGLAQESVPVQEPERQGRIENDCK